ncbi:MAG: peptidoglycan/xylan/chitin deacetylase (PgdA/CDA1 family) [Gammaproteobacteria bacterium]|jgi:peptidoglycan/xylan/chitin deacetylase (PgdA/CDA1 family)
MKRRNLIKMVSLGGTLLAGQQVAKGQSWGGAPVSNDYVKVDDGHTGSWPHWPFEEVHIPYKERFTKMRWPKNESLCVYMYVTGEWDGHPQLDNPKGVYKRDLRSESEEGQYEFNVGIWRTMGLLDKLGIKVSLAPHTGMVEKFPDLFRELVANGHEITARTFTGEPTTQLNPREERKEIQLVTRIIEKVTHKRPVGFNNPGGVCTEETPHILSEEGYIYMSGLKGDDLPYGIKTRDGKTIILVGSRHETTNDNAIFGERSDRSPEEAYQYVKSTFDGYYALSKQEWPNAFNYGIHPWRSAIPERIGYQERILRYMLQFNDVWWAKYDEIAEYWLKTYV